MSTVRKIVSTAKKMTSRGILANMSNHTLARFLALEGVLYTLIITLAHNNNNLYATRLGATSSDLGLIASLPPIVGFLTLIPFGIMTDHLRKKKTVVMLSAFALSIIYVFVGMTAFLTTDRILVLIVLLVIANIPMTLYNSSWQAFFSDVSLPSDRTMIYSYRTKMNTAVGIVFPLITGMILTAASGQGKILVHQIYYFLAFPLALCQCLVLYKTDKQTICEDAEMVRFSDIGRSIKVLFASKPFRAFLLVALVVYCGWELDWSLYFQAQFRYLHLNETQMSFIAVISAIAQFLTLGYWSRLSHTKGIRFIFAIGAGGFAFCCTGMFISLLLTGEMQHVFYYVFQCIGSSAYSAFQLSLLLCLLDVIPDGKKSLSIAIYNTILLFTNILMPYLGVVVYNRLGENQNAMLITMGMIAFVRMIGFVLAIIWWSTSDTHRKVAQ